MVKKLSRALMRRSMRLIEMEYKPSEIAAELAASKEQILRLISAGAPARKDSKGHYWIHGENFAAWLEKAAPKNDRDKKTFEDHEAYCLTCRSVVTYTEYRRKGNIIFGHCPDGHKVARFVSKTPTGKARKK